MTALRLNAPIAAATVLAERYGALAGELATAEASRAAALAATNAVADTLTQPIVAEMDAIRAALEPWWARNGAQVTGGKRKSAELGGCMLGSRSGKAALVIDDEPSAKAALVKARWGKELLRTTVSVDKAAVLKALGGTLAKKLAAIGFAKSAPAETFFLERVEQPGVVGVAG